MRRQACERTWNGIRVENLDGSGAGQKQDEQKHENWRRRKCSTFPSIRQERAHQVDSQ